VAVGVHVAILAGLVVSIEIPRLPPAPVIRVSLVPAWRVEEPRPPAPKPPPPSRPERDLAPRPARIVGPEAVQPLHIPPAPLDAASRAGLLAAPFAPHEPIREGLRAAGGCTEADWLKLSPAERDKCRQRDHDLGVGAPVYAVGPSDPSKRAFLDKQAAKNEARRRALEGPPTPGMTGCADSSRFSNLGFSCIP
jgi:hypothetical protein